MQIKIKLRTNIFADADAPALAKALFRDAARDRSTLLAVQRVSFALMRLVEEAARDSLLSEAALAAMESGKSLSDELSVIELRLLAQTEEARETKREFMARCAARQAEVQPVLIACATELLSFDDREKALRASISGFANARETSRESCKAAGFSPAKIKEVEGDIKPSYEDLEAWQCELERIPVRKQQITAFLKSGPEYDVTLLGKEQNANAGA